LRKLHEAGAEIAVETSEGILLGNVKHIDAKESILLLDRVTQILEDGQRIEHIAPAIIPFDMIEGISAIT
jgi:hypothetical protein